MAPSRSRLILQACQLFLRSFSTWEPPCRTSRSRARFSSLTTLEDLCPVSGFTITMPSLAVSAVVAHAGPAPLATSQAGARGPGFVKVSATRSFAKDGKQDAVASAAAMGNGSWHRAMAHAGASKATDAGVGQFGSGVVYARHHDSEDSRSSPASAAPRAPSGSTAAGGGWVRPRSSSAGGWRADPNDSSPPVAPATPTPAAGAIRALSLAPAVAQGAGENGATPEAKVQPASGGGPTPPAPPVISGSGGGTGGTTTNGTGQLSDVVPVGTVMEFIVSSNGGGTGYTFQSVTWANGSSYKDYFASPDISSVLPIG